MISSTNTPAIATDTLHSSFMALLPRIETQARIYFRDIKCAVRKADCIAEVVALAWKWFCRLLKRGKDATQFMGAVISLAARAVRSGRRVCRQESAHDAMNLVTQRRHNFKIEPLPLTRASLEELYSSPHGQKLQDEYEERLQHNTTTPILDQVAFRVDFPAWLKTLTPRERRIIRAMSADERTKELSRRFHVSPGRISQMRREFSNDWRRFCGDSRLEQGLENR